MHYIVLLPCSSTLKLITKLTEFEKRRPGSRSFLKIMQEIQ